MIQIYIVFNIWKHHFAVKITLRALLGVSDTSFLPKNWWFLIFYVISHPIMVWNGHKMLYILLNVQWLIQIITLNYISGDPILHYIAKIATFRLEICSPKPPKLIFFALLCGPWLLCELKGWLNMSCCIIFNMWK